jgi:hypothetical protein
MVVNRDIPKRKTTRVSGRVECGNQRSKALRNDWIVHEFTLTTIDVEALLGATKSGMRLRFGINSERLGQKRSP